MSKSNRRKNSGIRTFTSPPSTKPAVETIKPVKMEILPAALCPKSNHIGEDKNWDVNDFLDRIPMWFNEEAYLNYVHFMLSHFRKPAVEKMAHEPFMRKFNLFATFEGTRWKVTGASRFGDIFLAKDLKRENGCGYNRRVMLNFAKLTEWSDLP
jgi:hypothetical protein